MCLFTEFQKIFFIQNFFLENNQEDWGQIRNKGNFAKQNFPDMFNGTHRPRQCAAAGWRTRAKRACCLRQSEFDVSQILTVLGGGRL